MEELDAILGIGIVAVLALTSITNFYLVRHLSNRENVALTSAAKNEEEDEEETSEESEPEEEASNETPSKEQIIARRAQLIRELEEERGTRVLTLIHRKEPWSSEDDEPEIVLEDSEVILQQVRETPPDKPIDFIVHTEGGLTFAADLMAMALRFHKAKVTVMVPFYAMSGGSLMSLAAGEIRMEKYSVLGPVDPQIPTPGGMHPAGSLATLVKTKPIQTISDKMVILADAGNLEVENAKAFVMWLLEGKMDKDQAERVADFLARGYMSHATPITLDVARTLGLNVVEGVPDKVYELFKTFAFTGQSYKGR